MRNQQVALNFFHRNNSNINSAFSPLSVQWNSSELLGTLAVKYAGCLYDGATSQELSACREDLRAALLSEYDAVNLSRYLLHSSGIQFSSEFLTFEALWRRDEWNHTVGCAIVFSILFGIPQHELFAELRTREPQADFTPIAHLLSDEFSVLATMAYDEIRSTKAYLEDRNHFRTFREVISKFKKALKH